MPKSEMDEILNIQSETIAEEVESHHDKKNKPDNESAKKINSTNKAPLKKITKSAKGKPKSATIKDVHEVSQEVSNNEISNEITQNSMKRVMPSTGSSIKEVILCDKQVISKLTRTLPAPLMVKANQKVSLSIHVCLSHCSID